MPRRSRRAPAAPKTVSAGLRPFVLALVAVALMFGIGYGVAALHGQGAHANAPDKPVNAQKPALAATVPIVTSEPEPEEPAAAAQPPASPAPQAPVVAMLLPPPRAPQTPLPPSTPDQPLWRRNALPYTAPPGRPLIAVVIDDLGLDRVRSARVVRLPGPLTTAWLPYAHDLPQQTRAAREAGHELLLHMPMEPIGSANPGPEALRISLDSGEILRRFDAALDSFEGYVGVNNHMGSRFTSQREGMNGVVAELRRRGLLWLDSRTTPHSVASAIAVEAGVPSLDRDVFLDNVQSVGAVRAELARLEDIARLHGRAIAIGHPHDATIDALQAWLPTVSARGFALAPVSALVK